MLILREIQCDSRVRHSYARMGLGYAPLINQSARGVSTDWGSKIRKLIYATDSKALKVCSWGI